MSVYEETVRIHLLPSFANCHCICEKNAQQFVLSKIGEGLSQKSIKDMIVVLKMICVFGRKNRILKYEPFDITYPANEARKEMPIITRSEQRKLLNQLSGDSSNKAIGIIVCLFTGLRIGEICALTVEDIDFSLREITVSKTVQRIYSPCGKKRTKIIITEPKTPSSWRRVPISSNLFPLLKEKCSNLEPGSYLLSGNQNPIEPRTYRKYFDKILLSIKIGHVNFHALRHTFATRCIESNSDYKTVSCLLGHSNISTTLNLYVHPNKEQKRKCVERMIKSL